MIYLYEAVPNQIEVKPITKEEEPQAKEWILHNHYLKRWPTGVRYKLGVYDNGGLVGVLLYGPPLRAQSGSELFKDAQGKSLLKNNQVLELLRAYTTDKAKQSVPNLGSIVISRGNEYIRTNGKTKDGLPIKAVLSYADPEAGHSGGVYKATNASYLGAQRPSQVLTVKDNVTGNEAEIHPMSLKRFGTTDLEKLKQFPIFKDRELSWKPVAGKHKYLYPLGKDQRERNQLMQHLTVPLYSYPNKETPSTVIDNPAKQAGDSKPAVQQQKEPEQPKSKREVIKTLLRSKVLNPETNHMILVGTALKYDNSHPVHKTAMGMVRAWAKKHNINLRNR